MANTGVMLLTAPAMFGPIRRLDSKLSRATAPGKNSPMQPKRTAAAKFADPRATKNGAAHQKSSVEEGMLHAAPSDGGIHRNPNCVRTKPLPKPSVDTSARTIAVLMTYLPDARENRMHGKASIYVSRTAIWKILILPSGQPKRSRQCFAESAVKCATSRCAWTGRARRFRTQIVRRRGAQASASGMIRIGIERRQRRAAAAGMTARPIPLPTTRQTASKPGRRTRSLRCRPARAAWSFKTC